VAGRRGGEGKEALKAFRGICRPRLHAEVNTATDNVIYKRHRDDERVRSRGAVLNPPLGASAAIGGRREEWEARGRN